MIHFRPNRRRASALFVTLVVVFVASFGSMALIRYVYGMHRLTERSIAMERASVTAEAGLHELLHYFIKPTDAIAHDAIIAAYMDNGDASGLGGETVFIDRDADLNPGHIQMNHAEITRLWITAQPRAAGDVPGFPPSHPDALFTFWSTAEAVAPTSNQRVEMTAMMDVRFADASRLALPAAIIAGSNVSTNGQFNVYWGEAWSKANIQLLGQRRDNTDNSTGFPFYGISGDNNQSNNDPEYDDDWVMYRSVGHIVDSGGTPLVADISVTDIVIDHYRPGNQGNPSPKEHYMRNGEGILRQGEAGLEAQIDDIINYFADPVSESDGYHYWKAAAIARDTYYRVGMTNAAGVVIDDKGVYNASGVKIFDDADAAMMHYRSLDRVYVAFFDTKNGLPPADDGSNWANLNFSGSVAAASKGILYFCGNLNVKGSPEKDPKTEMTRPDDKTETPQNGVFHVGVVYTHGKFESTGNPVIYGSIVCRGSYGAGGTPDVYYNINLELGDPQPISSRARILATVIR